MKRKSFRHMTCSVARTLEVVGEHWSLLVVRDAFMGVRRFEDYQESLGIARNILAARLRRLVEQGVLERRAYQENPPRFEYRLTEKGVDLYPVIVCMQKWGDRWASGAKGPPVVLIDRFTGDRLDPILVDRESGAPLDPRRTSARAGPGANAEMRRRLEAH
jgi:DNA-binding HxlR family transcriptional regulator